MADEESSPVVVDEFEVTFERRTFVYERRKKRIRADRTRYIVDVGMYLVRRTQGVDKRRPPVDGHVRRFYIIADELDVIVRPEVADIGSGHVEAFFGEASRCLVSFSYPHLDYVCSLRILFAHVPEENIFPSSFFHTGFITRQG